MESNEDWASEIGQLFLAFGNIEFVTIECLRDLVGGGQEALTTMVTLPLASRLGIIEDLIKSKKGDNVTALVADEILSLTAKIKSLLKWRNLVAHNPLTLSVIEDQEGRIKDFEQVIASLRIVENRGKAINFDELRNKRMEAEEINVSFHTAYSKMNQNIWRHIHA